VAPNQAFSCTPSASESGFCHSVAIHVPPARPTEDHMGFTLLAPESGLDKFAANRIRKAARLLIGKYGFLPSDLHDIEQELAAEVIAKFPKWDPAKGSRTTFIATIIDRKVASMVRERRTERRNDARSPASLDGVEVGIDDETTSLAQVVDDAVRLKHLGISILSGQSFAELRLDARTALSQLNLKQRNLCRLLMSGMSIAKAARVLGISRTAACKRRRAILKHFEDLGLRKFL